MIIGSVPQIPAPTLIALADRLETAAREAAIEARDPFDGGLSRVTDSVAMLSVTVRRLADSGPRAHIAGLRRTFSDDYQHLEFEDEPLASQRAHVDVVAFLAVGDMVLDDIAGMVLERDQVDLGDYPWRTYMDRIDDLALLHPDAPMVRPARQLDLLLREARHRLVAHRLHGHLRLFAWGSDGTQEVERVNPDGVGAAFPLLLEANRRLRIPLQTAGRDASFSGYATLVRWILRGAGSLDRDGRRLVRQAFREAGYTYSSPTTIGDAVIALVAAAKAHPRAIPAARPQT